METKIVIYRNTQMLGVRRIFFSRVLIIALLLSSALTSCNTDPYDSHWVNGENYTICQYLEANQQEFSKSYRLLAEGKMLSALCAYNPYGEGYTLFLPTNEAIDRFVQNNPDYHSFEEMLQDTSLTKSLTRYHTINKGLHTDDFPDGALTDSTLTGERLTTGFYTDDNNLLIKINNTAPIIESNLEMTNGYIHVVSEVIPQVKKSGLDWLEEHDEYSILAETMKFSRIENKLWWKKYTILAEHDSVYHKKGIFSVEDLKNRVDATGNSIYQFAAFHIVGGALYLNDLEWGNNGYWTLANKPLRIDVKDEIQINRGVQTFEILISETGDTTLIDYVSLIREKCNIKTATGPVHTISDLLFYEPFAEEN